MLEVHHRDGHGRIASWQPEGRDGPALQTPAMVVPDDAWTPQIDWPHIRLAEEPSDAPFELISGGTWFHPATANDSDGVLVVPAPEPAPTTQVQVLSVGEDVAVFHDAGGWMQDPSRGMAAWIEATTDATPGRLLWTPLLGTPASYALFCYLGADLFDAAPLLLAAARGEVLTTDGAMTARDAARRLGGAWDTSRIVAHNLEAARQELATIAAAIETGSLRALVERRIYTSPWMIELLRRFDAEGAYLESAAPAHAETRLDCHTYESLWEPSVRRFRHRLRTQYRPPDLPILVLLPCSQRKPYATSPSHRRFRRAIAESGLYEGVHEVMVTSPLGLVPRELETMWPAANYDVPVTGRWMADEADILRRQLAALLERGAYQHVIVHLGDATEAVVREVLPDATYTVQERPTAFADLQGLTEALRGIRVDTPAPWQRKTMEVGAIGSYQFGSDAGTALIDDAKGHGKPPYLKLAAQRGQGPQLGMTRQGRGLLSLTLEGAERLQNWMPRVRIGDFEVGKTKSLFAVGVESADANIRLGDEVLVTRKDDTIVAVGVAMMSGAEMDTLRRGVAVQMRHVVRK